MAHISRLDSKKIKHRMVDLDVTNRELARRLRLRENTLSRYINGRRRNPEAARLLARALKMKIEEITLKNGDRAA